jgi:hypothetical protein
LVTRDANNQIINVATTSINVANFSASGTDIETNYRLSLSDYGDLNFSLKGTYLNKRQYQTNIEFPDIIDEQAGQVGTPKVRGLLTTVYNLNNLTASWTVNYIGESDFDNNAVEGQYPDWFNNKVSAYTYHGINLNYFAAEDISIYGVLIM